VHRFQGVQQEKPQVNGCIFLALHFHLDMLQSRTQTQNVIER
jgi:hypothetical protein